MIIHTKEDLFTGLRKTYLLGFPNIKPYANATFEIQKLNTNDLIPSQKYYLKNKIQKLIELQDNLRLNIFDLDGYISFFDTDLKKRLGLTPPFVEVENDKLVVLDGMHRVMLARLEDKSINCVVISNYDTNYLSYAKPNENGWEDVVGFEEKVPDGFKTREHRYGDDYRKYARTFALDGDVLIPREHSLKSKLYRKLLAQDRGR